MARFITTVMLQDVTNEDIYTELDQAMMEEDGYPYLTGDDDKIYALPPDMYEFDLDVDAKRMSGIIKLICGKIEKKHNLKKTPVVVSEVSDLDFSNLEELKDEDFQQIN